jgi:hypothetical protein
VTRIGAGRSGVPFWAVPTDFSLLHTSEPFLGPSQSVPGMFSPYEGRPELEVNNTPRYSAKLMNEWSCTSTTPIYLGLANLETGMVDKSRRVSSYKCPYILYQFIYPFPKCSFVNLRPKSKSQKLNCMSIMRCGPG